MHKDIRDKIRQVTESSGVHEPDFLELLQLIDQHYDKMEATITQSLTSSTPLEAIFDSVTEALLSVSESGKVRICNQVAARYFHLEKSELIGSSIERFLPGAKGQSAEDFLEPFMTDLDDTHFESRNGEVDARRDDGTTFIAEINAIKGQMRARITLHACDYELAPGGPWVYEPWEEFSMPEKLHGGGGTDFRPVFEWLDTQGQRPELLVYFTDAQGQFPQSEPNFPVIWLVKGKDPVPWGQRVQLN